MIAQLQAAGRESLDLFHPAYRDSDKREFPLDGLCHPLSQALFCLFPGAVYGVVRGVRGWRWPRVLARCRGQVVDLVAYPDVLGDEDYDAAERLHWRPRRPTQRTRTLLARAGLAIPCCATEERTLMDDMTLIQSCRTRCPHSQAR